MPDRYSILRLATNHLPLRRGFAKAASRLHARFGSRPIEDRWRLVQAKGLAHTSATNPCQLAVNLSHPDHWAPYFFTKGMAISYLASPLAKYMPRMLNPDSIFIDIGANFGFYSLIAGGRIECGSVIAFEPMPTIFESLRRTIEANRYKHIIPVNLAMSDASGTASLIINPHNFGGHSIASRVREGVEHVEVQMQSFSEWLEANDEVDQSSITLIKIDVEAAEERVVRGLSGFLEEGHRPVIHCEVRGEDVKREGGSGIRVAQLLAPFGYLPHRLDGRGVPKPFDPTKVRGIADLTFLPGESFDKPGATFHPEG